MLWWRSGWDRAIQTLGSAEIKHHPRCAAHQYAGHSTAGNFKGHPTLFIQALQECHHFSVDGQKKFQLFRSS